MTNATYRGRLAYRTLRECCRRPFVSELRLSNTNCQSTEKRPTRGNRCVPRITTNSVVRAPKTTSDTFAYRSVCHIHLAPMLSHESPLIAFERAHGPPLGPHAYITALGCGAPGLDGEIPRRRSHPLAAHLAPSSPSHARLDVLIG